MNFLLIVESYWGAGHMNVTAQIAQAMTAAGHGMTIAASTSSFEIGKKFNYGTAALLALPGLEKDVDGKAVITAAGLHLNDDAWACIERTEIIRTAMAAQQFDGVIIEAWPFGISVLDNYFKQVASMIRDETHLPIYGLARDVLGYPEPRMGDYATHDQHSVIYANEHLDLIFVAGDSSFSELGDSLDADAYSYLEKPVDYIGYVGAADMPARQSMPDNARPVIIAGGGTYTGSVRDHMDRIVASIAHAKSMSSLRENPLLVFVGEGVSDNDLRHVETLGTGITAMPFSKDFRQYVANAALVVNKGGRNIAVDCIQALQNGPVAQIITPMEDDSGPWPETVIRAAALQKKELSVTLDGVDLDDEMKPLIAIEKSLAYARLHQDNPPLPNLNGAQTLVSLLTGIKAAPELNPPESKPTAQYGE